MNPWFKLALAATLAAIVIVFIRDSMSQGEADAWSRLAEARVQEDSVEALERVRESADGTASEPWVAFDLTMALYDKGGAQDLKRAAQVAQATLTEYPDHAVSTLLKDLLPALKSYGTAPAGS